VLPYYALGIRYNPNFLPYEIQRPKRLPEEVACGFSQRLELDSSNFMARPQKLYTDGVTAFGSGGEQEGDWSAGEFVYDGSGNIVERSPDGLKTEADMYAYDALSRLVGWSRGSTQETYGYDFFGNLTDYAGRSFATSAASNRLANASYDASGNLTGFMEFSFAWDALGQQLRIQGNGLDRRFAYDASGERLVERAGGEYTFTLRRWDARVVRQVKASLSGGSWSWSWEKDWVWGQGSLLATISPKEGLEQVVVDHQGSAALLVNRCGRRIAQLATNPWGLDGFVTTQNPERHRYTGHLRDVNAPSRAWDDFDQMHARTYFPYTARFLSPDPGRDYDLSHPQSFNLYAYARNNPVNAVDPSGRATVLVRDSKGFRFAMDANDDGVADEVQDSAILQKANQRLEQGKVALLFEGKSLPTGMEHLAAMPKSKNAAAPPNHPEDWEPASWQSGLGQPWDWIAQNTDVSVGVDFWALNLSAAADSRRVSKAFNFSLFAAGLDVISLTFGSDRRRAAAKHLVGVTYGIPPIIPPASPYGLTFTLYLDGGSLVGLSINFGLGAFIQPKLTDYRKWR